MKIGVIICTYKRKDGKTIEYLTNTLNSVLNQTYKNYKIFLIGDRYEDEIEFNQYKKLISLTDNYCENLEFAHERDVYGDNKQALWSYAGTFATNYAMDLCVKENIDYVCFLNHDDFWYPNHLEEIAKLVNNDKTDFIITKSTYKNGYLPRITSNDKYIDFLPVPCGVIHSSVCMNIKTIPLRYIDLFKETGKVGSPGDAEYWVRVSKFIINNKLKSKYINNLTCRHDEEGYELSSE
jgi:glycosyltransferase involved in cell wall biosynthesis